MNDWYLVLPHVNASLNALATILLLTGFVLIKQRRERAHRQVMLATFVTSVVFLVSYLVYHGLAGSKRFPTDTGTVPRSIYYFVLLTHVVLAATVPFFAITAIVLGYRDRRAAHRRVAKWAFPIWLYVSVTGVVVYVMLYHLYA